MGSTFATPVTSLSTTTELRSYLKRCSHISEEDFCVLLYTWIDKDKTDLLKYALSDECVSLSPEFILKTLEHRYQNSVTVLQHAVQAGSMDIIQILINFCVKHECSILVHQTLMLFALNRNQAVFMYLAGCQRPISEKAMNARQFFRSSNHLYRHYVSLLCSIISSLSPAFEVSKWQFLVSLRVIPSSQWLFESSPIYPDLSRLLSNALESLKFSFARSIISSGFLPKGFHLVDPLLKQRPFHSLPQEIETNILDWYKLCKQHSQAYRADHYNSRSQLCFEGIANMMFKTHISEKWEVSYDGSICSHSTSTPPFSTSPTTSPVATSPLYSTLLYLATAHRSLRLMEFWLREGSCPDIASSNQFTPLHLTVALGWTEGFVLLRSYGAYTINPSPYQYLSLFSPTLHFILSVNNPGIILEVFHGEYQLYSLFKLMFPLLQDSHEELLRAVSSFRHRDGRSRRKSLDGNIQVLMCELFSIIQDWEKGLTDDVVKLCDMNNAPMDIAFIILSFLLSTTPITEVINEASDVIERATSMDISSPSWSNNEELQSSC